MRHDFGGTRSPWMANKIAILAALFPLLMSCEQAAEDSTVTHNPDSKDPGEVLVHDAGFRLIAPRVWSGHSTEIQNSTDETITLVIANHGSHPVYFNRFDTFRLALKTESGEEILFDGGRDGTRAAPTVSPLIEPGATHEIVFPANLVPSPNGSEFRLSGTEPFGGIWYFDGLTEGEYFLQGIYENDRSKIGDWEPVWTGKARTRPIQIEIRQSPEADQ
ncbi:MAG: hypothetical protein KC944_15445 [Candidatus Omnitrophica bacterium]|nr:hypothetical protein [Candidatus Omnitrophota bacterium]